MRRIRKIKKIVTLNIPKENAFESRITRGNINKNVTKKVSVPTQVERHNVKVMPAKKPITYKNIEPIWNGETVYLIGGGPSLRSFQWERLRGKKTIAINKAVKFWPEADAMYWTDGRIWTWIKEEIKSFKGMKFTIAPQAYPDDVHLLGRGMKYGLETSLNMLAHGNNSGYAAINLAIHLGAKRIILLGYDMGNDGKVSHFHEGYPVNATGENIYKNQFLPGFEILKGELMSRNIQIFNACPTSKLNAFKKITIEEALAFR